MKPGQEKVNKMSNLFNFPGEKYTGKPIYSQRWEGPGWYATARDFPGQETYTLTRIGESWFATDYKTPDQNDLDTVTRSFGHGTLRWYNEPPQD